MTATRRSVVAGVSTTVLAGGLFLGAPAAVAVPGDTPPGGPPPGVAAPAGADAATVVQELAPPVPDTVQEAAPPALDPGPVVQEAVPPPPDPGPVAQQAAPPALDPGPLLQEAAPPAADPAPVPQNVAPPVADPGPVAPPAAPEVAAQVSDPAPVNQGLNVDTFLTTAPLQQPAGAGVLTALLAAAVALPGALALRARRLGRA